MASLKAYGIERPDCPLAITPQTDIQALSRYPLVYTARSGQSVTHSYILDSSIPYRALQHYSRLAKLEKTIRRIVDVQPGDVQIGLAREKVLFLFERPVDG